MFATDIPTTKTISSVIGLPDENQMLPESFLYTEVVPLEHGEREITRVSDVEYEGTEWVARLRDGTEIARHVSRERVLELEREVIDRMISEGADIPMGFKL